MVQPQHRKGTLASGSEPEDCRPVDFRPNTTDSREVVLKTPSMIDRLSSCKVGVGPNRCLPNAKGQARRRACKGEWLQRISLGSRALVIASIGPPRRRIISRQAAGAEPLAPKIDVVGFSHLKFLRRPRHERSGSGYRNRRSRIETTNQRKEVRTLTSVLNLASHGKRSWAGLRTR